jgi:hypothetical protein
MRDQLQDLIAALMRVPSAEKILIDPLFFMLVKIGISITQ